MTRELNSKPNVVHLRGTRAKGGGNLTGRVEALEARMTTVELTATEARDNTAEILAIMTATKTGLDYVKKYGKLAIPAVLAFAAGRGWIEADLAAMARTIFGA